MTALEAAVGSSLLLAWAVGGPLFGGLSDRIGRRKPVAGCAVTAVAWSLVIFVPGLPLPLLIALLIVIGFAAGCMIIGFAFAKESVPASLAGDRRRGLQYGVDDGADAAAAGRRLGTRPAVAGGNGRGEPDL